MERSTSPLTYKGGIRDAIIEAQRQKKLFVVYISGEDENSINLEQSTWVDARVAESMSKYCIFLHLTQGSLGASQFSAIYPQKSVPSISAVGYNGVLLWQQEVYIDPESLVLSIEKSWATLHLQETAATFLSAALASKQPETLGSSSHSAAPVEKRDPSTSDVPSNSAENPTYASEARSLADPKREKDCEPSDHKDTKRGKETCPQSESVDDNKIDEEQSNSTTNTSKEILCSINRDVDHTVTCNDGDFSMETRENLTLDQSHTKTSESAERMTTCSPGSSHVTANEVEERSRAKKADGRTDFSDDIKSNDIHLNIRLPSGANLQAKFTVTDTLKSVKNYIDENQISAIGSYDLAVPYPRKVFNEQDMNSALSELGFASRQALIVVPHHRATGHLRGQVSSNDGHCVVSGIDSSNSASGGYFGYVKWILSYVNPFSYLGGNASSSSSETASNDGLWQYRPNPALQSQLSGSETSHHPYSSNSQNTPAGDSANNMRRRTLRPFGSNIHTLRQNEDEGPSGDRNTFWNGNSTQYGGNDK